MEIYLYRLLNCCGTDSLVLSSEPSKSFLNRRRSRFVRFYVIAWSWLIQNTNNEWIVKFFEYAQENAQAKHEFTYQVRLLLRDLDESQQQEWWNVWLKDYWKNRLEGVPCPLEDRETAENV